MESIISPHGSDASDFGGFTKIENFPPFCIFKHSEPPLNGRILLLETTFQWRQHLALVTL